MVCFIPNATKYNDKTIVMFTLRWKFKTIEVCTLTLKEALYDITIADIRSKRHFWSELIRFLYRQIHYTPLELELV